MYCIGFDCGREGQCVHCVQVYFIGFDCGREGQCVHYVQVYCIGFDGGREAERCQDDCRTSLGGQIQESNISNKIGQNI